MNPLRFFTQPFSDLWGAVVATWNFVFVVGLCALVNWMTHPGYLWVKWVALGMGIAAVVAYARALRALVKIAVIAAVGWWIWRRYGEAIRARYDAWREERAAARRPVEPREAVDYALALPAPVEASPLR
jgi:hypothetical protein